MHSEKAAKIASLARSKILGGKILSLNLSDKHSPHFAKILLQNYQGRKIAVVAALQSETAENILTYAFSWFFELEKLKTKSAEKIWLISPNAPKLAEISTLFKDEWQRRIRNFDLELNEIFAGYEQPQKVKINKSPKLSLKTAKITSLAPNEIQLQGNNFLYLGLPFGKIWRDEIRFGMEHQQTLNADNEKDLLGLLENLRIYRRHDSPNKSHIYYKLLPEAWLESILRRDISVLDANLILSPLHQQFRASTEQIDLLALRKDGRLVIIELKVSPNREHFFQAVDYWQQIEKHRRAGNLCGLFGGLQISEQPSLVYLVAPHSSYAKELSLLAQVVSPQIDIYRFDLHENWREKIIVLERKKI